MTEAEFIRRLYQLRDRDRTGYLAVLCMIAGERGQLVPDIADASRGDLKRVVKFFRLMQRANPELTDAAEVGIQFIRHTERRPRNDH